MPSKEFRDPVLEDPPELSPAQIERVAELTGFARERVKTVIEVSARAGLGSAMHNAVTDDLAMILCALHGLPGAQVRHARSAVETVPF